MTVGDAAASFAELEAALGGASAAAFSNVGAGQPVTHVGVLAGDIAWSTIKVPLALAVLARLRGRPSDTAHALIAAAITTSDNAAAEELWTLLGAPEQAGAAVQAVLAGAGDATTRVETRRRRPEFTAFGQTRWSVAAQQRFVAALPGLPHAAAVRSLMARVVPEQRWGLGVLGADVELKGGWGPDAAERHLVRQMGFVPLPGGRLLATAIASMPADGSFESGTANLTAIARWLADRGQGQTT